MEDINIPLKKRQEYVQEVLSGFWKRITSRRQRETSDFRGEEMRLYSDNEGPMGWYRDSEIQMEILYIYIIIYIYIFACSL